MIGGERNLREVIERCYAGVLDEAAWQEALVSLGDLVGGGGVLLFAMEPTTQRIVRHDSARVDPSVMTDYNNYWVTRDIRVPAGLNSPVGVPQSEETMLSARTLRRSEIYNDFLRPVDSPHLIACWLHRSPERVVALSIQGSRRRGAFTSAERDQLGAVVPHLARAVEIKDRLALRSSVSDAVLSAADTLHSGVVIIDTHFRIVETSATAALLLAAGDGAFIDEGALRFRRAKDGGAFSRMMHPVPESRPLQTELRVPRQRSCVPLSFWVAPVQSRTQAWMTAQKLWIVLIKDPALSQATRADRVALEFGLTMAEARVACAITGGATVRQLSTLLGVSVHTLRTQLKSIYSKTGLHTQVELVRCVLALSDPPFARRSTP